jgi:dTDP-4-amino-4,6-dideoxygalactose transaminase
VISGVLPRYPRLVSLRLPRIDRRLGSYEREFEQRLEKFLDVRHFIVTCNGTIALEILIRALGLQGEVLRPSSPSSRPR